MLNKKIFKPGPVQVHPEVLKASVSSISYNRSSEFKGFHGQLITKLKQIFLTNFNLHILTTSGNGAIEAALLNFYTPAELNPGFLSKRLVGSLQVIRIKYRLNFSEYRF